MVRKSRKGREEWKTYKNVFDELAERNLFELSTKGHFQTIEGPIALGKEANLFAATRKDGTIVAIKIYRLQNCNFNKMYSYICQDPRFTSIKNQKRKIIFSWVQREFRNLLLSREKIRVPTPYAFKDNIIIMEFIGENEPAPKLKDAFPKEPEKFFEKILEYMKGMIDVEVIHGDLSEFNILNYNEEPVFIDFSQGTTARAANARELLERDAKNVISFFKKKLNISDEREKIIVKDLLSYYDKKMKT
jgi:RIO kinase 1